MKHIVDAIEIGADAVAMADVLHYDKLTMQKIHSDCKAAGLHVRRL